MIRILFYLVVLAAFAYCADWLIQHPGHVEVTWLGYHINTYPALVLAAVALTAIVVWTLLRFFLGFPSFLVLASRQRRREKGYAALSRGLIALGAGDARGASRASAQASKHLRNDPMAMLLQAQSARLMGDGARAEAAYADLAQREDTRILGLRGLHDEAFRRGDDEAARHFAAEAHKAAPLPWSAQTVLAHRAAEGDWEKALATVETSISAKLVDRETGDRQRAVLQTAIGLEKQDIAPDEALALARAAIKRVPNLVPAIALAARLYTRRGEIRKATKLIEGVWPRCQHPELARVYLDVRPGDSTTDRLARAQTLMRISAFDPISRMTVARAALAAKDFSAARAAMAPLIAEGKRPSVRACLVMADLEDAEFGDKGHWREWLARASRASLDPAWIADGIVYEQWEPVSPTTGRLDAFLWQAPADRPGHAMEAMPAPPSPASEMVAVSPAGGMVATGVVAAAIEHRGDRAVTAAAIPPDGGVQAATLEGGSAAALPKPDATSALSRAGRPKPFKLKSATAPDDRGVEESGKTSVERREDMTTLG